MDFERISRSIAFHCPIFDLAEDKLNLPNGRTTTYAHILHNGAACILPVTDGGDILFVRQFRPALGAYVLELPAGRLEPGEEPLSCAARELREECGYTSRDIEPLLKLHSAVGYSNELIHIYTARNLEKSQQEFDEDEIITLEQYSTDEAIKKIMSGEITDSKTIGAIFAYSHSAASANNK